MAAPTNSVGGILAATASPVVSYQIGQYFKGKEAEGSTAHLVAHAVLGAAVAAAGASSVELAAQYLINHLSKEQYPEAIHPTKGKIALNRLPENVKVTKKRQPW